MALDWNRFQHSLFAQTGADAVREKGKRLAIVERVAGKVRLLCCEMRDGEHGKADEFESVARIDLVLECGKFLMEQTFHQPAHARAATYRPDAADRAIDPEKCQFERARTLAPPFEIGLQRRCQLKGQDFDVFEERDCVGQMPLHGKRRHGQAR